MTEAQRHNTFLELTGWLLVFSGLIGFFLTNLSAFFAFAPLQNALHVSLGALSLWVCYRGAVLLQRRLVLCVVPGYLLLGLLGLVSPSSWYFVEPAEGAVYLLLGVWGAWAAYSERSGFSTPHS